MGALSSNKRPVWHDIVFFTLSAGLLRFFILGNESFWIDEMATFHRVSMTWEDMFARLLELKYHPPLHYCLAKLWCGIAGYSEFSLRFISALSGMFAAPFFYLTALKLTSRKAARFAAGMFVLSAYHIQWAQEARFYSLMGLLTCVSMYFFVRLIQERRLRNLLALSLASALLLYNHYYGIFVIASQNLAAITQIIIETRKSGRLNKKDLSGWIAGQILAAALFIPWFAVLLQGLSKYGGGTGVLERPGIIHLLAAPYFFAGESLLLAAVFAALFILYLWAVYRAAGNGKSFLTELLKDHTAIWWLVVTVAVPYLFSLIAAPVYSGRYILAGSFAFFILAGRALSRLERKAMFIASAVLYLTMAGVLADYYIGPFNENWKAAAKEISAQAEPSETVIIHPAFCRKAFSYYYHGQAEVKGFPLLDQKIEAGGPAVTPENAPLIQRQYAGANGVWLVYCHSWDEDYLLVEKLNEDFTLVEKIKLHKIEIFRFDKRKQ
ncbi:putative membrane protein [Sedimentisphaera cyanobacteriorum]|uniref:Putative membrane protein n=1 Tax=Sedimentisphaera cyanobacteriorum TaxID=1940790 RepID=A0A1Q2HRC4_9BACT|nr:glycosyltransferase family 39 protein [Sedimentisphaera cyanobacteriorum]AQQ09796.1 putative membrane protein [Sedimentisphaera cyanobacteriorum]